MLNEKREYFTMEICVQDQHMTFSGTIDKLQFGKNKQKDKN